MISENPRGDDDTEAWNVLVTGFGPFHDYRINPSFLIANSLQARYSSSIHPPIKIHAYPNPIDVRYTTVRQLIPKLLFHHDANGDEVVNVPTSNQQSNSTHSAKPGSEVKGKYDLVLHIGLAAPRTFYTLETCAHRDGYAQADIDGRSFENDTFWRDAYEAPELLRPSFDTLDVWRRWKSELMEEDVQPSDDAGHFLCDFTYYSSMVEYWRRDPEGRRPCMFLHVPGGTEEKDLARGRQITIGLIIALIRSEMAKRKEQIEGHDVRNTKVGIE